MAAERQENAEEEKYIYIWRRNLQPDLCFPFREASFQLIFCFPLSLSLPASPTPGQTGTCLFASLVPSDFWRSLSHVCCVCVCVNQVVESFMASKLVKMTNDNVSLSLDVLFSPAYCTACPASVLVYDMSMCAPNAT